MAYTLKFKRYTSGVILATTGADGEIFVDTTNKTLVVQDGTTVGGSALATQSSLGFYLTLVNFSNTLTSFTLNANLTSTLANYTTNVNLTSTLLSYTLNNNLTSTLIYYIARPEFSSTLTSTLANYPTNVNLTSTLVSYTLNSSLSSNLTNYALSSTLTSYTTNANLTSTLTSYQLITSTLTLTNLTANTITVTSLGIVMPNRPAFRVVGNGATISSSTILNNNYWILDYEQGTGLNTSTGVFTAPIAGLYQVNAVVRTATNTNSSINQIIVAKIAGTSTIAQIMIEFGINTSANHMGGSTITRMNVGDQLNFRIAVGQISFDGNDNWSVVYLG